jgi:phage terminase large subunit-like protein
MRQEEERLLRAVERLARLDAGEQRLAVTRLTVPQRRTLHEFWPAWAHEGQREPWTRTRGTSAEQRTWLLMAGRGFGKTRAGAEWVSRMARAHPGARIALVGASLDDVRKVMIEGRSGLVAVAGTGEEVNWLPGSGRIVFSSGAEAFAYSGERPDMLRGPEHHFAWCDEIAKWRYPEAAWDNLQLGLRLGDPAAGSGQLVLVTTTPRPIGLVKRLVGSAAVTRGRTSDNWNLPPAFVEAMIEAYGGTRLGRQELDGELIEDVEGALWSRELIEQCRVILPVTGRGTMRSMVEGGSCGVEDPLHRRAGGPPSPCRGGLAARAGGSGSSGLGWGDVRDRGLRVGQGRDRLCAWGPFGSGA